MATDINFIRSALEQVRLNSSDRVAPEKGQKTKEVLSNLVLANGATLRKVIDDVIAAQKKIKINDFPREHATFEKLYKIGSEANKKAAYATSSKKGELQNMLSVILIAMSSIEDEATIAIKRIDKASAKQARPSWNEAIQSMFAQADSPSTPPADQIKAIQTATGLTPVWDEDEDKLLPMACCSNQEWGLLYSIDGLRRIAFFPFNSDLNRISDWCDDRRNELEKEGSKFLHFAVVDPLGSCVWKRS